MPAGCAFAPRCARVVEACRTQVPRLVEIRPDQTAACLRALAEPIAARELEAVA
jgi:ABC-type dipeptide/oligopeptide/nickel transport system ATPase component